MDNIKETIKENLIRLRKEKKMTQLELAEKINYSDKAISRWEKGEVTPDIETLEKLSKVYDVPFECFFAKSEKRFHSFRLRKIEMGNKLAISLLAIICVWFIATFLFVYLNTFMASIHWIIFVWAVPCSCIVGIVFNSIWGKMRNTYIIVSILIWSLITAICLQIFINFNIFPWLIYIVGIPMQIATILFACLTPSKRKIAQDQNIHHE